MQSLLVQIDVSKNVSLAGGEIMIKLDQDSLSVVIKLDMGRHKLLKVN